MTGTRLYNVWQGMKSRCDCISDTSYKYYGGRGTGVCDEWSQDFRVFLAWSILNGYTDELELDRIDTNGDYTPSNCRFVTKNTNNQNRRDTKLNWEKVREMRELHKSDIHYSYRELARIYNISEGHASTVCNNKAWVE